MSGKSSPTLRRISRSDLVQVSSGYVTRRILTAVRIGEEIGLLTANYLGLLESLLLRLSPISPPTSMPHREDNSLRGPPLLCLHCTVSDEGVARNEAFARTGIKPRVPSLVDYPLRHRFTLCYPLNNLRSKLSTSVTSSITQAYTLQTNAPTPGNKLYMKQAELNCIRKCLHISNTPLIFKQFFMKKVGNSVNRMSTKCMPSW